MATKQFTADERKQIRQLLFPPTGNDVDFGRCVSVAEHYGLNPFLGEIQFVERSEKNDQDQWVKKIIPMVGRDGYLTIAHKSGKFDGGTRSSVEMKEVPILQADGSFKMKNDLVATAEVWQKGASRPTVVSVNFSEYCAKTRAGAITSMWRNKSITMICKVAESQALRKAFSIHGLYSAEEMGTGSMDGNSFTMDPESINVTGQPAAGNVKNKPADKGNGQQGTGTSAQSPTADSQQRPAGGTATGATVTAMFIDVAQFKVIEKLLIETGADQAEFLKACEAESLDKLPAAKFNAAVRALEKKKQTGTAGQSSAPAAPAPQETQGGSITDALASLNIPFEVVGGQIVAKPSFDNTAGRAFVKEKGFKWDKENKAWKIAA